MREAKKIATDAQQRYEDVVATAEAQKADLNNTVEDYLELQVAILRGSCRRFIEFVESIGQKGSVEDLQALEAVGLDVESLGRLKVQVVEAKSLLWGGVGAASAGASAATATTTLVGLAGTASTGTAIGGLSGAAANSATLAWLGGGSLAAGGGGMALGSIVLSSVVVGPTLAFTGWVLASQGEKALTNARQQESRADEKHAEVIRLGQFLTQVNQRVEELIAVARQVDNRASVCLDELESLVTFDVDNKEHVGRVQQAALLVHGLSEIIRTPILDDEGELNHIPLNLVRHLRRVAAGEEGE